MKYHNITHDDMLNGDGLRVVLWVSGCNHKCEHCQNPITWDSKNGLLFDDNAKNEIFDQLNKDYISGITLSGGDPLFPENRLTIKELIYQIKILYPTKTIWLYTGYTYDILIALNDAIINDILDAIDVLIDGPYDHTKRDVDLFWRGSSNQRVINMPETIKQHKIILHCE